MKIFFMILENDFSMTDNDEITSHSPASSYTKLIYSQVTWWWKSMGHLIRQTQAATISMPGFDEPEYEVWGIPSSL